MKYGVMAGGVCALCGSDTILGNRFGFGCEKMYQEARFIALKKIEGASVTYFYSIPMTVYMDEFVSIYEASLEKHKGVITKMFRNEFKRSFMPSVYAQYKEKGYVSKKQLDIVKNNYFNPMYGYYEDEDDSNSISSRIKASQKAWLDNFTQENDGLIFEIAKNMWHSKKSTSEEVLNP